MNLMRWIAAGILIQTLYFKFTGASESKFIFTTLGVEPWGRIFAGVSELVASVLLLIPQTQMFGALFGIAIMSGAILSHFFILGIVIQDDGGALFGLAVVVFITCVAVIVFQPEQYRPLLTNAERALRKLKESRS